ncbi:MAG: hypothetical protein ACREOF_12675 [Gemmatimonadales bacterium]
MVGFGFRVNHSFLFYPAHPITVPRSQVDYGMVREMLLHDCDVWIIVPNATPVRGIIYQGYAGYGPYYQIRSKEAIPLKAAGFARGDVVEVLILRAGKRVEVQIRLPPEGSRRSAA